MRRSPVHPHGRGEYSQRSRINLGQRGPSPRAWGIPHERSVRAQAGRSIPTGVGNTRKAAPRRRHNAVHPHGRGEYHTPSSRPQSFCGPSPRAWGIHRQRPRRQHEHRSIPTGVGNTGAGRRRTSPRTVHPHGRGEYNAGYEVWGHTDGPSPRAWGIREAPKTLHQKLRSIPTGVGNTELLRAPVGRTAVHPHGRGEYVTEGLAELVIEGPSPRAWGIHCVQSIARLFHRSIPTGVGNTHTSSGVASFAAVHPHGRGEYLPAPDFAWGFYGPSPRAWGILLPPAATART